MEVWECVDRYTNRYTIRQTIHKEVSVKLLVQTASAWETAPTEDTQPVPSKTSTASCSRTVPVGDGARSQVRFVETSSAGLRGQSGGPIFDKSARIYALQSQTTSLPLGFAPTVKQGSKEIVEHQFMHLGWGSDVQHCIDLMRANGVNFSMDPA